MALTAMAIYKNLPRTNCKDCGLPTCMAFAMQVAAKQKAVTACPHLSDDAAAELAGASAPPMKLVHIGPDGDSGFDIGQETVMFRHEDKFHRLPGLAAKVDASLSDAEAAARIEAINNAVFTRVGDEIKVAMAAVDIAGMSADAAAARIQALAAKSNVPLVVMGNDAAVMGGAISGIAASRPLIYKATEANADGFIKIAKDNKCPLAVSADSLEKLADLTKAAKDSGVEDMVLAFDTEHPARTIRDITVARRAALKKNFRPFGYPAMVDIASDNAAMETVFGATFSAKFSAIMIINGLDGAELLPVLTTIQNIYTDPQVPNTVDAKLYEIGDVTPDSPVLFTTNFSLTYFCVEAEVERSRVPSYICVVETEGLGVLNAYAGDKISAEKIVNTLTEQKIAEKVNHRKLIIPGLLPSFRAEIEDTSEWTEVLIGPENATGIPGFLNSQWK